MEQQQRNGALPPRPPPAPPPRMLLLLSSGSRVHVAVAAAPARAGSGANLRAAYVDGGVAALLPADPATAPGTFLLRSDDQPRTMESGQALFDGLYPPANSSLAAVPVVDWWTMDPATETIEPDYDACPALTAAVHGAVASPDFQAHVAAVTSALVAELSTVLGRPVTAAGDSDGISMQFDCFMTHMCYGKQCRTHLSNLAEQIWVSCV